MIYLIILFIISLLGYYNLDTILMFYSYFTTKAELEKEIDDDLVSQYGDL